MSAKTSPASDRHPGCIMILGSSNDERGNLSHTAMLRLRQGALEYERHRDAGMKIMLTGGIGAHFNTTSLPYWHYAKIFLETELSIPSGAILPDTVASANTVEDFEKAAPIFRKYNFARLILVTSAFHAERALYIATHALPIPAHAITVSPAPDDVLDRETLAKAQAHELRAIAYLKANYPPAAPSGSALQPASDARNHGPAMPDAI